MRQIALAALATLIASLHLRWLWRSRLPLTTSATGRRTAIPTRCTAHLLYGDHTDPLGRELYAPWRYLAWCYPSA